jgi:phage shock protein PspC (stress-responsive transcriptional regulator)
MAKIAKALSAALGNIKNITHFALGYYVGSFAHTFADPALTWFYGALLTALYLIYQYIEPNESREEKAGDVAEFTAGVVAGLATYGFVPAAFKL